MGILRIARLGGAPVAISLVTVATITGRSRSLLTLKVKSPGLLPTWIVVTFLLVLLIVVTRLIFSESRYFKMPFSMISLPDNAYLSIWQHGMHCGGLVAFLEFAVFISMFCINRGDYIYG